MTNGFRPYWKGCKYNEHAEMSCIKHLKITKKTAVDLVILRLNKNGDIKMSKPCNKCIEHLSNVHPSIIIKNVYYSTDDGFIKVKFNSLLKDKKYISTRFKRNTLTP